MHNLLIALPLLSSHSAISFIFMSEYAPTIGIRTICTASFITHLVRNTSKRYLFIRLLRFHLPT